MAVGTGSNLGQVRDGQHLAILSELLHQPADRGCHRATNPGVDLIENQRARIPQGAGGHGNRQRNP